MRCHQPGSNPSHRHSRSVTKVGQCPGILVSFQRRDTGTLRRFSVSILEEGGRLGLKCLLLSYFRMGDHPTGTRKFTLPNLDECFSLKFIVEIAGDCLAS